MTTKLGIAMTLDELRLSMREFLAEMEHKGHVTTYGSDSLTDWKFETFLQWLQRKQMKEGEGETRQSIQWNRGL